MTNGITMGNAQGVFLISASLTPASVATNTVAEQNFTVTGLRTGDFVELNPPSITAGVGISSARVSAADTLTVAFVNPTAGSLTPAAGTYRIKVTRPTGNIYATGIID